MKKVKEYLQMFADLATLFLWFVGMLFLMLIVFMPVLPIMFLGFPMILLNAGTKNTHWTEKPYLWWFNNVWLNVLKIFNLRA